MIETAIAHLDLFQYGLTFQPQRLDVAKEVAERRTVLSPLPCVVSHGLADAHRFTNVNLTEVKRLPLFL